MALARCSSLNFSFKNIYCISSLRTAFSSCYSNFFLRKNSSRQELFNKAFDSGESSSRDGSSEVSLSGAEIPTLPINEKASQTSLFYPAQVTQNSETDYTEIKSIPVQNAGEEEVDELAKSHMDKFGELMLSGEAKLQTPMLQVDGTALPTSGDLVRETTDLIFTSIDKKNFLEEGVVLKMPIPIEEVVSGVAESSMYKSTVPTVLSVKVVGSVPPKILPEDGLYSSIEEPALSLLFLSEEGLDSGAKVSVPTTPEPPLLKSSSSGPEQPYLHQYSDDAYYLLGPITDSVVRGSDDGGSSVGVYSDDDLGGGTSGRKWSLVNKPKVEPEQPISSVSEYIKKFVAEVESSKPNNEPATKISSRETYEGEWYEMFSTDKLEHFFGENDNSHNFFEKLANFVSVLSEKILPIVPNTTPAKASVKESVESRGDRVKL